MRSYLSLIPISAKVHRKQNRMTILCIIFAVFMVTVVFSMAEMGATMEQERLAGKHDGFSIQDVLDTTMGQTLLGIASVLFILILLAGVLMIGSSMTSRVAQRTQFFGMMRCIGMSQRQVNHYVRLEALNWCKTAVPIGGVLGVITTWILCAALRFLVGDEFAHIPLFGISIVGIISGVIMGVTTVLIAANSPAKRAAKVSPLTAVSGGVQSAKDSGSVNHTKVKIETGLGIQHALAGRKNFMLMVSSFALSIVLFLVFSVFIEFIGYIMPQSSNDFDIGISSGDGMNSIDNQLPGRIGELEGVEHVFARRNSMDLPAIFVKSQVKAKSVDLISYDAFDLESLAKDKKLRRGSNLSKVYGDSNYVLATWDTESLLKIGDRIQIGEKEVEIAGLLNYDPFTSDGRTNGKVTIISSGETFTQLTKIEDYSLVMIQVTDNVSDATIEAIHDLVGNDDTFRDRRDQRTTGTYIAFLFFVYGFLMIITLVTVLNIINSMSMSVSARIQQYGAMRAVGMDTYQLTKMVVAEALTYALSGSVVGCLVGLLLNKFLFEVLITSHFAYAFWRVPVLPMMIICLCILGATMASVYKPSKIIRRMTIADTLNEL